MPGGDYGVAIKKVIDHSGSSVAMATVVAAALSGNVAVGACITAIVLAVF